MSESTGREWRPTSRQSRADAWRLPDGDDLDRTLSAAERLLQRADEMRRHQQNRVYALMSVLVTLAIALFASLATALRFSFEGGSVYGASAALASAGAATAAVYCLALLRRSAVEARRNQQARLASDLASLVRETYLEVAERERWSHVRLQAVKIRLAAFPLLVHDKQASARRPQPRRL